MVMEKNIKKCIYVYNWSHFAVQQELTHYKSTVIQLKYIKTEKKKNT